jgi:hypothetical protein
MKYIFILLFITSCCNDPDIEPQYPPNCGVITSKTHAGDVWITCYHWNDGSRDTIAWHFDPVSMPGDTICKLLPVDSLDCKPVK